MNSQCQATRHPRYLSSWFLFEIFLAPSSFFILIEFHVFHFMHSGWLWSALRSKLQTPGVEMSATTEIGEIKWTENRVSTRNPTNFAFCCSSRTTERQKDERGKRFYLIFTIIASLLCILLFLLRFVKEWEGSKEPKWNVFSTHHLKKVNRVDFLVFRLFKCLFPFSIRFIEAL